MKQQIIISNNLVADQPIASSVAPATIGSTVTGNTPFSLTVAKGKTIFWRLTGLFTLGATGGFRLLAHNSVAVVNYNAQFVIDENTTPAEFRAAQTTEAAFANASAVAATYQLNASGSVTAGAGDTVFSLQFAQNTSDVLPITMKAGLQFEVYEY